MLMSLRSSTIQGTETSHLHPSMTEQGQVQDLATLIVSRNRGVNPIYFNGRYSQYDTADIQKLDFIELRELRDNVLEQQEQLKADHHKLTVELEKKRKELISDEIKKQASQVTQEAQNSHNT